MAAGEVRIGDIGTVFEFTIKDQDGNVVDISTATTKEILFRTPYGKILTKTATFSTNGADGKIKYTTVAGDINATGSSTTSTVLTGWTAQAHIITAAGEWKTDIQSFNVYANLS